MDVDIDIGMDVDMDVSVAGSSHKSSTGRAANPLQSDSTKTAASHTLSLHPSLPPQKSRAMQKNTPAHRTTATDTHNGTRGRRYQPFSCCATQVRSSVLRAPRLFLPTEPSLH